MHARPQHSELSAAHGSHFVDAVATLSQDIDLAVFRKKLHLDAVANVAARLLAKRLFETPPSRIQKIVNAKV